MFVADSPGNPQSFVRIYIHLFADCTDGDQNYFPVYEPDPEAIKKKYLEAEREARAHHYDSTKEGECVRHRASADLTSARPRRGSIPVLS